MSFCYFAVFIRFCRQQRSSRRSDDVPTGSQGQGVIPSTESGLWGGLVPLPLLQQALIHKHDQVSLSMSSKQMQVLQVFLCIYLSLFR